MIRELPIERRFWEGGGGRKEVIAYQLVGSIELRVKNDANMGCPISGTLSVCFDRNSGGISSGMTSSGKANSFGNKSGLCFLIVAIKLK